MPPNNVLFINPGRTINKNENEAFSKIQTLEHFVNFGLYSIIQELENNFISTSFHDFQLKYQPETLKKELAAPSSSLIGISIISAFNAKSANVILKDIKKFNKNNIAVIGGQHYIGKLQHHSFDLFPEADIVVSGEGELSMLAIAKQWNLHGNNLLQWELSDITSNTLIKRGDTFVQGVLESKVINLNKIKNHTYKTYPNINKLFPSVEYSRGCPHNCTFCVNTKSNRKNFRSRNIDSLKKSIIDILSIYSQRPLRFYLQASNFVVKKKEIENFLNSLSMFNGDIEWRTEVRVDSFDKKHFKRLYDVGLRIIDIGLDSASKNMIEVMRKSANPEQYLKEASIMLRAAREAGIFTKINFLIHPGDTVSTLEESKKWLQNNKEYISAISICPALIFTGCDIEINFKYYQKKFGTELIADSPLAEWGVFEVNPSREISINYAKAYSIEISRIINSQENYAYAKSFGYHGAGIFTKDLLNFLPMHNQNHEIPYHA